jgi:hypothetical protein
MDTDGSLALTLSATDALAMAALAVAKSVITVALRIKDDDFTLKPASPELFVATFRSLGLRDQASKVSTSQERPLISSGQVEVPAVMVPPVEVPLREVLIGIGPTDEATAPPPHAHQIAVIPAVDSVTATDDRPPPEPCAVDGGLQLTPLLADDNTPPGSTPPRPSTLLRVTHCYSIQTVSVCQMVRKCLSLSSDKKHMFSF